MRAETTRSGLAESIHHTSAFAVDMAGRVLLSWGNPDRPLFYRSTIKPFQATVALEAGARLFPEEIAVASSSHTGAPAHLAYVRSILHGVGLDERALQTPHAWPNGVRESARARRSGHRDKRRIFHNCSGKHSAWLAACRAADWPIDTYLDASHPIQIEIRQVLREVTGSDPEPVGIDNCGAPTLRRSVADLARGFAVLSVDHRFAQVSSAVSRFSGLVSGNERPVGRIAAWWDGPMKSGAQGLLAAGRNGVGIATKAEDGSQWVSVMAMMEVMRRLATLSQTALDALDEVAQPPVLGGGRPVGRVEAHVDD